MRTLVERRKLEPGVQVVEHLVRFCRKAPDEMLQDGRLAGPEATALRHKPAVEVWAAVHLQPIQELTDKQPGKRAQVVRIKRLDARLGRAGDLHDVNEAVGKIERDGITARLNSAASGLINDTPDLAEAPAQFAPRVVRNVP